MTGAVPTSSKEHLTWQTFILYNQYHKTRKEEPPYSLVLLAGRYPGRTSMSC